MNDTAPEVEAKYREMLMAKSPGERLAMCCRMFGTAKTLVQAGLVQQYGHLSRTELRRLTFLRFYGQDFTESERERIVERLAKT